MGRHGASAEMAITRGRDRGNVALVTTVFGGAQPVMASSSPSSSSFFRETSSGTRQGWGMEWTGLDRLGKHETNMNFFFPSDETKLSCSRARVGGV